VWLIPNWVGAFLVAPIIVSWSGFRAKRSGGLTMRQFAVGAFASALFLGALFILFPGDTTTRFSGSVGMALTYVPALFVGIIAMSWGTREASLVAFIGR